MDKLDLIQIKNVQDFLGGSVDGSMPVNAGDTAWIPGPGRSHTPRGNSNREPHLLSLGLNPRATTAEVCAPRACALQQEKLL